MLGRSTLRRSLILLSVGVLVLYNILVFLFSMLFMEPYYLHKVEQTLVNAYETIRDSGEYDLTTISSLEERNLEINIADPDPVIEKLVNYGSLFIGGNTAEVFGDYASGTNHTLPTVKAARYTGGVYVGTFLKVCTHQSMTQEASKKLAPLVDRMAKGEGLIGHAIAAQRRF